MRHLDKRTVKLSLREVPAHTLFNEYLDEGKAIPEAALLALTETEKSLDFTFTDEFIKYLSEDTLIRHRGKIVERPVRPRRAS